MEEMILKRLLIGAILLSLLGSIVTQNETVLSGTILLVVLLSPFGVAWYIHHTSEIRRLREKIQDYRPGQWTIKDTGEGFERPSKVRLGVFGVQDSGKSSFLNSLHFAFKGGWEQVYVEKGEASNGGETIFRDPARLTDYVTTFDTRGLVDLSIYRVPEVIAEITGKRGINTRSWTKGEKIDCPIFILRYSSATGTRHCTKFLETLVPQVRNQLGGYPIMVVTFAKCISNQEEIIGDITRAGMEKGSVFLIENYTDVNHEMDSKKHIALLNILEACIKRADDSITFQWRKENETPQKSKCEIM
ncbi:uncharacterized protein LOC100891744 isoform X1 [Strongylocentrotus purpuratus]|uniref:G domain-containing protein n=1 Tax=Strongylocentrotus purpuratus TaxID=7668 RepID=A0A7M7LPD3_STRPU|nr:uncharacterized protein LOC100891744 isoform X1 [Strongylocentrotus purpuratus]